MRKKYFLATAILALSAAIMLGLAFYLPIDGTFLAIFFLLGIYVGFSAIITLLHALLGKRYDLDLTWIILSALAFFQT